MKKLFILLFVFIYIIGLSAVEDSNKNKDTKTSSKEKKDTKTSSKENKDTKTSNKLKDIFISNSGKDLNKYKSSSDPTKIITKVGGNMSNVGPSLNGSLGLDETKKINFVITYNAIDNTYQYQVGLSWLFKYIFVNASANGLTYSTGINANSFFLGTYVPFTVLFYKLKFKGLSDIEFAKKIAKYPNMFIMAGYSYSKGTIPGEVISDSILGSIGGGGSIASANIKDQQTDSNSGYIGAFGLVPLYSDELRSSIVLFSFGGYVQGVLKPESIDIESKFQSYFIGGGLMYKFDSFNTIGGFARYTNSNIYGDNLTYSLVYIREFSFRVSSIFGNKSKNN